MAIEEAELEQFSDETRSRLKAAADALTTAIKQHTERLLELSGGSSQVREVFELNDTLRRAAASWDDAVFDHTGTFPLALELDEDDDDDEDDEDDEDLASEVLVSVVSRWDVEVTSVEGVVAAGREAHRRNNPDESDEDARATIGDDGVGQALYALVHDFGEPWFDVPGLELAGAHRVYVARNEQPEAATEDEDDGIPLAFPMARCSIARLGRPRPADPRKATVVRDCTGASLVDRLVVDPEGMSRLTMRRQLYAARARWGSLALVQRWRARPPRPASQKRQARYRDLWTD